MTGEIICIRVQLGKKKKQGLGPREDYGLCYSTMEDEECYSTSY